MLQQFVDRIYVHSFQVTALHVHSSHVTALPMHNSHVTALHVYNSLTAPFNFGPADWTSFVALQPRLDASPMENVLWRNNLIIPNLKIFYSVCKTWHFSLETSSFKMNVSRQVVH
jgi:hypothetical protein